MATMTFNFENDVIDAVVECARQNNTEICRLNVHEVAAYLYNANLGHDKTLSVIQYVSNIYQYIAEHANDSETFNNATEKKNTFNQAYDMLQCDGYNDVLADISQVDIYTQNNMHIRPIPYVVQPVNAPDIVRQDTNLSEVETVNDIAREIDFDTMLHSMIALNSDDGSTL